MRQRSDLFGGTSRLCLAAAVAMAVLSGAGQTAWAEEAVAAPRYSLQKVTAGYLRIDRKTGQVSHCREQRTGWVCRLVADDRTTLLSEIERLRKEIAGLRNPGSASQEASPAAPRQKQDNPAKTERREKAAPQPLARGGGEDSTTLFQRMVRRFVAFARKVRRDLEGAG